ncbi:hypothetical protein HPP92_011048 [Vanilla planifolia]|uniref:RING-type E3 ubiquitin transferase n=1 Tax=Vanilla planifolia TaxID=51239 RepID=A0A835V1E8_VANPL|nr:hypothetical protein HPP92_011048 [Vanilla planifolia]
MAYTPQQTSRIHLVLAGAGNGAAHSYPLDSAVLNSIPIITFSSVDSGEGMDCAVCLSEFFDGEATRILPGCRHGFHLECIDMWFSSHSTCPICRRSVDAKMSTAAKSGNEILILAGSQQGGFSDDSIINSAFPSRQLQREIRANSAGEGSSNFSTRRPGRILVIDMPRFVTESSPSSLKCSGSTVAEEVKLPTPAVSRSLRERDIEKAAVAGVGTAGQVDDMT